MARTIDVKLGESVSSFNMKKVDRKAIYGRRARVGLDPEDRPCSKASLTVDGSTLLRKGMTAQGYFTDGGAWVANADLVGLDAEGTPVAKQPSTLGVAVDLRGPVPAQQLLDLDVSAVYALEASELDETLKAALDAGELYEFDFNYRADYRMNVAILVGNGTGIYALIGLPSETTWSELEVADQIVDDDDGGFDDDLDFEMF